MREIGSVGRAGGLSCQGFYVKSTGSRKRFALRDIRHGDVFIGTSVMGPLRTEHAQKR